MTISYLKLKRAAFFCLVLPSVIFLLGFLRWYIGVPVALLLAVAYLFAVRRADEREERALSLPRPSFWLLFLAVIFWCYLAGLGNLYAQSDDWSARNAIFRDLIRMDWPVVYETKNAALVYYIGYWLPAALVGKGALMLTGRLSLAWTLGNLALWAWSAICVFLVLLLVLLYMKAATKKQMWLIVLIFVFFSGLDIVGTLYNLFVRRLAFPIHIEWWTVYQFSSMTTALNWVFNQSIFAWLASALFLLERRVQSYAFIIVCLLAASPLPAVGLALYMVGYAVVLFVQSLRKRESGAFWQDVLTVQNVIAVLFLLPIYFLYYKTNLAVNVGQFDTVIPPRDFRGIAVLAVMVIGAGLLFAILRWRRVSVDLRVVWTVLLTLLATLAALLLDPTVRFRYFVFLCLEVFVFLALIWREYKDEPLFYLTWGIAMLCPIVTVGTAADFCMRASIPVVFVTMILCIRYLFEHRGLLSEKKMTVRRGAYLALIAVMILGAVTPTVEFYRGARDFLLGKRAFDWIYTMDQIFEGALEGTDRNFIARTYREHFFFRYLTK